MNAKVAAPDLAKAKRILAISDIHGNLELMKGLLKKVGFSESDFLVLLGDYIEKGPENLATLRYVMELSKRQNVCALSGNCDTIWEDVRYEKYHENLLRYMLWRKESVLNEMCAGLGIEVRGDMDKAQMQRALLTAYAVEFEWLENLPHIVDTPELIFVHAGIADEDLNAQDANECMMFKAFLENAPAFSRYVVAGHWPTVNYTSYANGLLSHMPIIDKEKRIVSIDGGNVVKRSGQLNCLIYADKALSFACMDDLPCRTATGPQEGGEGPVSVTWMHNELELLQRGELESACVLKHTGQRLSIPNEFLFEKDGVLFCHDYTNYVMPLREGDAVSIVETHGERVLVKRNGVLGWMDKALLTVN
ncbi:MAG: metallophosphoesterase [Clostridiaceae bacterium]|nr:metallophosphoesterase [Eubacteriales bacterium]